MYILQADLWTLDDIQARHNSQYKNILLSISVFGSSAYVVPLRSQGSNEVARALESIFKQDPYRKIQTDREANLLVHM